MNNLLDAIKKHRSLFISTISVRQSTSSGNKDLHQWMKTYIQYRDWEGVAEVLRNPYYRKPLGGVVFCLNKYKDLTFEEFDQIVTFYEEGKFYG